MCVLWGGGDAGVCVFCVEALLHGKLLPIEMWRSCETLDPTVRND